MPDESPTTPSSGGCRWARGLREILLVPLAALVILVLLRTFVAQVFVIPSDSMQNTLQKGDKIAVSKVTTVHRGDAVVFADFAGWVRQAPRPRQGLGHLAELVGLLPDNTRNYLVKRVIGMPGDRVVASHGSLSVNGFTLDESSYRYRNPDGSQIPAADVDFDITVPAVAVILALTRLNGLGVPETFTHVPAGGPAPAAPRISPVGFTC